MKIVRTIAATVSWAAFGTTDRRLRMKWTRHRCQAAPCRILAMAWRSPSWASEITKRTPFRPRLTSWRREVHAGGDLGDLELDGADPGVPAAGPVAVAVGGALRAPLVVSGPDLPGDLGLHHQLSQHLHAFTKCVDVVLLQ